MKREDSAFLLEQCLKPMNVEKTNDEEIFRLIITPLQDVTPTLSIHYDNIIFKDISCYIYLRDYIEQKIDKACCNLKKCAYEIGLGCIATHVSSLDFVEFTIKIHVAPEETEMGQYYPKITLKYEGIQNMNVRELDVCLAIAKFHEYIRDNEETLDDEKLDVQKYLVDNGVLIAYGLVSKTLSSIKLRKEIKNNVKKLCKCNSEFSETSYCKCKPFLFNK